jgi:hypothetical protein
MQLVPKMGPPVERTVEVRIPRELAGRDVDVDVIPGYEITPEMGSPENLTELLDNELRHTPPRTIVLQYRLPGQGVTYRGHVAGRLPSFALDALRPANADAVPESYNAYSRTIVASDKYVEGHDRVRIKVRPLVR